MPRLVYGFHPVEELLRQNSREVRALLVARQERMQGLLQTARKEDLPIQHCTPAELDAICDGASHQGIAALVGDFPYLELEDLLERAGENPLLLVLDSVLDPQNLGAIMRSALVLGVAGVVLPRDRAAGITPAVVRVSAGATEHLPCARVTNLVRSMQTMKDAGLWIAGAVEQGGVHPAKADLRGPTAIVLGNEQKGIRPLVLKHCDLQLTIPARSPIASLNVSAAAACLCYEALRQRG